MEKKRGRERGDFERKKLIKSEVVDLDVEADERWMSRQMRSSYRLHETQCDRGVVCVCGVCFCFVFYLFLGWQLGGVGLCSAYPRSFLFSLLPLASSFKSFLWKSNPRAFFFFFFHFFNIFLVVACFAQ